METVLVMPSPDRGREFVLPLSLGGVRVRVVVQSGNQLIAELSREPAEVVLLPETLPDGPVDMWLTKIAAVAASRPLCIVLVYGVESSESLRERVRATYGPAVEVVAAGARPTQDVANEVARLVERLSRMVADQDRDAFDRLRQPVPPGAVPQPVQKGGTVAFLGTSGGVGTSTLVSNLAVYAAMAGQRVLIVDAQFATAGSAAYYLGIQPDEYNRGLHHLKWGHLSSQGAIRDSVAGELLQRAEEARLRNVRHAEIRVLGVPAILDAMVGMPGEQIVWGIQALERHFDLVLADCGTGFGEHRVQKILEQASRIFLVAGGWGISVSALVRGLAAMEGKPVTDRLFLLLREASGGVYGTRTVRSVANMPVYGRVPEEPLLRKAETRLGFTPPLVAEAPDAPYSKSVAELAFALGLVGKSEVQSAPARRSWFGFRSAKA